jgi:epsilon-lactone hydrolase
VRRRIVVALLAALGCERGASVVPTTISPEWQEAVRGLDGARAPRFPGPDDVTAWAEIRRANDASARDAAAATAVRYGASVRERRVGPLRALEVTPRGVRRDGRLVVHLHGGGYATGSPEASLVESAVFADAAALPLVSLDYPLAPDAKWNGVVPAVVAALAALADEGQPLAQVALFGESAGGGLAAGVTLALRDEGRALPGALVLWSPWADVTGSGDSYQTLRDAEPVYRYDAHLGPLAAAYAAPADRRHPYVSPVYGDFAKAFPPTLIQGGTHELLLSDFVRLYQAIEAGGGHATLDLYEGMPHLFPHLLPAAAESQRALAKARRFLDETLPAAPAGR